MTTLRTRILRSPTGAPALTGQVSIRSPYDQIATDGTTIAKGLVATVPLTSGAMPDTVIPGGNYEVKIRVNSTTRSSGGNIWFPIVVPATGTVYVEDAIEAFTVWEPPVVQDAQAARDVAVAKAAEATAAAASVPSNVTAQLATKLNQSQVDARVTAVGANAYAPLQPVPRISAAPVAVRSDVQVVDAPSAAPNGWASIPWNDTSGKFTIRGGTLTNSPDYGAGAGVNLINGGGTGTAFTLDTWLTGTSFAVQMVTQPDAGDYAVFVDGQPVTESVYQTITGIRLVTITMPSFGVRRVSLRLCGAIANIFVAPDSYLSATGHKSARVALLGDSWGQGWTDGSIIYAGSVGGELARQASWDVWNLCQGGTGYSYPGSGQASAYGSTARLNALAAIPQMDAIVVIGGGNDALNNVPAATVQAAATAFYAAIAAARPGVPVIVVGAQVGGILEGSAASFDAVNNAIKAAAQAAPNVALFVDMRAGKWITGTGGAQQVKGDGSADVLMNGIHLTRLGSRYVASRIVGSITAGRFQELASPSPAPLLTRSAADSAYAPRWQPNTAYAQGQAVVLPDGTTGTAKQSFTSGSTFDASKWSVQSGLSQSTADALYTPLWQPNTAYAQGQRVVSPSGAPVTAKAAFTSGATYNPSNWVIVSPPRTVVFHDFSKDPDGALPTQYDSGQATARTGAATPTVASGFLVIPRPSGATTAASYLLWENDTNLTEIGADFTFDPTSTNSGVLAMVLWDQNYVGGNATICHLVLRPDGWIIQARSQSGVALTTVAQGQYEFTLTPGTIYRASVTVDRDNSALIIRLPDGTVRTLTDPLFSAVSSKVACWEHYVTDSNQAIPKIKRVWTDAVPSVQKPPAGGVSVRTFADAIASLRRGLAAAPPILVELPIAGSNGVVNLGTSYAKVSNEASITATAGVTGKIIFEASVWLITGSSAHLVRGKFVTADATAPTAPSVHIRENSAMSCQSQVKLVYSGLTPGKAYTFDFQMSDASGTTSSLMINPGGGKRAYLQAIAA